MVSCLVGSRDFKALKPMSYGEKMVVLDGGGFMVGIRLFSPHFSPLFVLLLPASSINIWHCLSPRLIVQTGEIQIQILNYE